MVLRNPVVIELLKKHGCKAMMGDTTPQVPVEAGDTVHSAAITVNNLI